MRIALVLPLDPALRGNGSAHRARVWRRVLAALGDVTTIVVPVASAAPAGEEHPELGELVVIEPMELAHPRHPWFARRAPQFLGARHSTDFAAFDVVVGFRAHVGPFCIGMADAHDVPIVLDLDDDDVAYFESRGDHEEAARYRALLNDVLPNVDIVCSASGFAATERVPNVMNPVPPANRSLSVASRIVMAGNFDYAPNREGVTWFVDSVWPLVRSEAAHAELRIVGPGSEAFDHGVGFVDDISAEYHQASVAIVPVRSGSGTRIKVLDAWSHGVPVVSTEVGVAGLGATHGVEVMIADDATGFAHEVVRVLTDADLHSALAHRADALLRADFTETAAANAVAALLHPLLHPPKGAFPAPDLAVSELDDGLAIHEPTLDAAHHLNPMAAIIFSLCDGTRTNDELRVALDEVVPGSSAGDVLDSTIEQLVEKRLLRRPRSALA